MNQIEMWSRLQDLKVRCLDHMSSYSWTDQREQHEYWWAHYLKLNRLQMKLI